MIIFYSTHTLIVKVILTVTFTLYPIYAKKIKTDLIEGFILAKYEGDTSKVSEMISNNFIYNHPKTIGLGIDVSYDNGSFIVVKNFRNDSNMYFAPGDKIYEINNRKVSLSTVLPHGPIGSIQKLILSKRDDSLFVEINVPLLDFFYTETKKSFLKSINLYSQKWYDFDVTFLEKLNQKEKAFVYYKWEGSKVKGGSVYIFYAMEILKFDKKKEYIENIETIWSKDIFMKQFLH